MPNRGSSRYWPRCAAANSATETPGRWRWAAWWTSSSFILRRFTRREHACIKACGDGPRMHAEFECEIGARPIISTVADSYGDALAEITSGSTAAAMRFRWLSSKQRSTLPNRPTPTGVGNQ